MACGNILSLILAVRFSQPQPAFLPPTAKALIFQRNFLAFEYENNLGLIKLIYVMCCCGLLIGFFPKFSRNFSSYFLLPKIDWSTPVYIGFHFSHLEEIKKTSFSFHIKKRDHVFENLRRRWSTILIVKVAKKICTYCMYASWAYMHAVLKKLS